MLEIPRPERVAEFTEELPEDAGRVLWTIYADGQLHGSAVDGSWGPLRCGRATPESFAAAHPTAIRTF